MKDKFSSFEKLIKEKVNAFEVPYDASQFSKLQSKMKGGTTSSFYWLFGAAAVAGLIIGGANMLDMLSLDNAQEIEFSTKRIEFSEEVSIDNKKQENAKSTQELKIGSNHSIKIELDKVSSDIKLAVNDTKGGQLQEEVLSGNLTKEDKEEKIEKLEELVKKKLKESKENTEENKSVGSSGQQLTLIQPILLPNALEFCQGETIELDVIDVNDDEIQRSYTWFVGGLKVASTKSLSYELSAIGNNEIFLLVSTLDGKVKAKSQELTVLVKPSPKIGFEFVPSDLAYRPENEFINTSEKAVSYVWDFGDYQKSNQKNPNHIYRNAGNYVVKLTAQAENGCSASHEEIVRIKEAYNLLAPTSFTPDGDGLNETWMPEALNRLDFPFTLTIFDRAGRMVYQTKGRTPWDGTSIVDGSRCKRGEVYVWQVKLINDKGVSEEYSGHVTLN